MSLPRNGKTLIDSITIYGFGPLSDPERVDASSFVQKLLAFCTYNKIPFSYDGSGEMSPKAQRCPWMRVKTNDSSNPVIDIEDSQRCIEQLSSCFAIDMDAHLTPEQKVQSDNLRYLAESVLYYTVIRCLWVNHREFFIKKGKLPVPDFLKSFVVNMIRKDMINTLNLHGNGDLTDEESEAMSANIYRELARVLGRKKFMFSNDKPSLIDVVLVRFFDKITESRDITPDPVLKVFEEEFPELKAYGDRLQETFFPKPVAQKLIEEGTATYLKAKERNTKIVYIGASVVVGVLSAVGYFAFNYLKGNGYF